MIKTMLLISLWLITVPIILGFGILKFNSKGNKRIFLAWIIGLLLSFAIFELFSTPLIFLGKQFTTLKRCWLVTIVILVILSIIFNIKKIKEILKKNWEEIKEFPIFLTLLVVVILGMQCYNGFNNMYQDYDDSNFMAKAVITRDTNTMFVYDDIGNKYDGFPDRQVFSPFPTFTAMIADYSGLHPTVLAHSIFPVIFLILAYDVYYLLGSAIFKHDKKKTMLFLLFLALVYSFGDVTRYAASSRILFRSWQGKSLLASIIIPFIIYVFIEHVGKEDDKFAWLVLFITTIGTILLSTMGVMLPVLEIAILTVLYMIKDSSFGYVYKFLICIIPNLCYAFGYVLLKELTIFTWWQLLSFAIAGVIIITILFFIRKFKFNMVFKVMTVIALVAFCALSLWFYIMFVNPYDKEVAVNLDNEKYAGLIEFVGKKNIHTTTDAFNRYVGEGRIAGFGFLAIIFVTAYYLREESENKDVAYAFGFFSILTLSLALNIFVAKYFVKIIESGVYWRMYWLVPTSIIMPIAFTELVTITNKRVNKLLVTGMIVMLVAMTGKWIFTEDHFEKVANYYKIPDHLLEVIMVASADEEENKKLAGPLEALVYTRQVDGTINLAANRSFTDNYGKNSLITYIKEGQINKILPKSKNADVNYIIMSTNAINTGIGILNE